jgi:hypothetical protein
MFHIKYVGAFIIYFHTKSNISVTFLKGTVCVSLSQSPCRIFSLLSKNESRLIKSPFRLSVCVSPTNNFEPLVIIL